MTSHYDYLRPRTLDEARRLLAKTPAARYIAGGTDLIVQLRKRRLPPPPALISLRNIAELREIAVRGDGVRIGAGAALTDVLEHADVRAWFPALVESIEVLGSRQIRNVATLGGNLCNASPAADTAPPLIVYGARVEAIGPDGTREIAVEDLFAGPGRTTLAAGEVVTAIEIDRPPASARAAFLRKGRVAMDLAIASVAVYLDLDGATCRAARIAAGAVAPTPLRLTAAEAALAGTDLNAGAIERAVDEARRAIAPITDIRSTAEHRRALVGVYLARAVARATGGQP